MTGTVTSVPRGTSLQCSRCGGLRDAEGRPWCRSCHAAYNREWRKTNPLKGRAKKKDASRSYAGVYLRRGKLKRQPCMVCGDAKSEMHHPDHEQPLLIAWLCRKHHLAWHSFSRSIALEIFNDWATEERAEVERQPARKEVA